MITLTQRALCEILGALSLYTWSSPSMGIFLNTNMNALKSQRQLRGSGRSQESSLARLSSGLRVNGARDDAAGLSISGRMETQTREMGRSISNANDAVSLVQTAEGALGEVTNTLQRMRELSVQAANETSSRADREAIQAELDQLKGEIDKMGGVTFNGRALFGEHFEFFLGSKQGEGDPSLSLTSQPVGSERLGRHSLVTSAVGVDTKAALGEDELVIVTRDGRSVPIFESEAEDDELSTANRAGSAIAKAAAINASTRHHGVTARAEETVLKSFGSPFEKELGPEDALIINGVALSGFTVLVNDADGTLQEAINAEFEETGVLAHKDSDGLLVLTAPDGRNIAIEGEGDGAALGFRDGAVQGASISLSSRDYFTLQFKSDVVNLKTLGQLADVELTPIQQLFVGPGPLVTIDDAGTYELFTQTYKPGPLDPDLDGLFYDATAPGNVTISGGYDGSILGNNQKLMVHMLPGDNIALAVIDANNQVLDLYTPQEGPFTGDGTYTFTKDGHSFGGDPVLKESVIQVTLNNTQNIDKADNFTGGSAFSFTVSEGALGDGLGGGAGATNQPVEILIGQDFGESTLSSVDVTTSAGAEHALNVIDFALEELNQRRATLGAKLNRFESSVSNLGQTKVNMLTAQSRIRDADFAQESARLSRSQILQQASASILAQANASPQLATQLLAGV